MKRTVLIVDDAPSMRKLISLTLTRGGYEAIEAAGGAEAMEKIVDIDVDMVITDLNMPDMDGIELIKKLRSLHEFRFKPIVMLTTESQKQMIEKGRKAGANGWIIKPFRTEQLVEIVKKFVT